MKKLSILLSMVLNLLFLSCDMGLEEIRRENKLEYITVNATEAKCLEYNIKQKFDPTGIKVLGHYSDNSVKEEDTRLVTFEGFCSEEANESLPVKVFFEGKETSFNIKILESKITSIYIDQKPDKLFYNLGDSLELTGLCVIAVYSNDTIAQLQEDDYEIVGFNSTKYGESAVNIRLKSDISITTTFTVYIRNYNIEELNISQEPDRKIYMKGEELNLKGLIVTAKTSAGGSDMTLNPEEYLVTPSDITNIEPQDEVEIKVSVNNKSTSFKIKIVEAYVVGAIVTKKNETEELKNDSYMYYVGEIFDLHEKYDFYEWLSNGTPGQAITKDLLNNLKCDFDGQEIKEIGIKTISVDYTFIDVQTNADKTYTINFDIFASDSKLDGIDASWSDEEGGTGYPLGITPDNSNPEYGKWTITGKFTDKNQKMEISPEFCIFKYKTDPKKEEIYKEADKFKYYPVVISFYDTRSGKTFLCEKDVKVIPPILVSVKLLKLPKTTYFTGETFKLDDIDIECLYSDGATINYTSNSGKIRDNSPNPLQKEQKNVVLTIDDQYDLNLPIVVTDGNLTGIKLSLKAEAQKLVFRKGKEYTTSDFLELFNVNPIYNYITNENEQLSSEHLHFSLTENNSKYNVYVVFTDAYSVTYSTFYNDSEHSVTLLPALPKSISLDSINENEDYTGLDNLIKESTTRFLVTYDDNTSSILESNKMKADGSEYTVETNEKNNLGIIFSPNEKAYKEEEDISRTFIIPILKAISMEPKSDYESVSNRKFRICHNYEYQNYFNLKMEFTNGKKKTIKYDEKYIKFIPNGIYNIEQETKDSLIGKYTENNIVYSCLMDVTYCPALPIGLEVFFPTSESCNIEELIENCNYIVKYEDGSISNIGKGKEKPNFDIKNEESKYLKFKFSAKFENTYKALDDPDLPKIEKTFNLKSLVVNLENTTFVDNVNLADEGFKNSFRVYGVYESENLSYSYKTRIPNNMLEFSNLSRNDTSNENYYKDADGKVTVELKDSGKNITNKIKIKPQLDQIGIILTGENGDTIEKDDLELQLTYLGSRLIIYNYQEGNPLLPFGPLPGYIKVTQGVPEESSGNSDTGMYTFTCYVNDVEQLQTTRYIK